MLPRILVIAVVLLVAGCGGGGAGSVDDIGRSLARAQTSDDALRALDDLGENRTDRLLRDAFCEGVDSFAEGNGLPAGSDWADFLRSQLLEEVGVPGEALELADEFGEALDDGDEYSAGHYVRGCGFIG